MFLLATVCDTVRVPPAQLEGPRALAVEAVVRAQYVDRVVDGLGLCVAVHSVDPPLPGQEGEEVGGGGEGRAHAGGYVHHGDGCAYYRTTFRLVVFRPFPEEVIEGWLSRATKDGLWVSLGFFTDIFVPHTQLAQPSEWDDARQSWVYFSGGDDEEAEVLKHDYDEGQRIRFKVTKVAFQFAQANAARAAAKPLEEGAAGGSTTADGGSRKGSAAAAAAEVQQRGGGQIIGARPSQMGVGRYVPPMVVVGSVEMEGLGMCEWWDED